MKILLYPVVGMLMVAVCDLSATTHYVSWTNPNPTPPYVTWATAATNIQDAINAAAGSDTVIVTNGMYSGGLSVSKPLTLLSANGALFTTIDGGGTNRCITVTGPVSMSGFSMTNGWTMTDGGAAWSSYHGAFLTNCILSGSCASNGGGAYECTLYNCLLTGNCATNGGAAFVGDLFNCTITGNSALRGGGTYYTSLRNCIVYYNIASTGSNYTQNWGITNCCTTPDAGTNEGNITSAPLFIDYAGGNLRLQSSSPCIDAGNNAYVFTQTDLDGNTRISGGSVDIGAYEFQQASAPIIIVQPVSQSVYAGNQVTLNAVATGSLPWSWQWRLNGSALDKATNSNLPLVSITTNQAGNYSVVITNTFGAVTSQVAVLTVLDTKPSITSQPSSQTVTPGTNVTFTANALGSLPLSWQWQFNGTLITNATNSSLTLNSVKASQAGAYSVIVSNSLGSVPSAQAILTVRQSAVSYVWQNSPSPVPPYDSWATAATNIQNAVDASLPGAWVIVTNGSYPGGISVSKPLTMVSINGPRYTFINGGGTNQCIAITDGVELVGFTLTNGWAKIGGGVWCNSTNAYLTNCVITGNVATLNGGGAFGTTLYNCLLTANSATNGIGGGACYAMLYNCTVTGNSANSGGGATGGISYNSILYNNTAPNGANYTNVFYLEYCCTTPAPTYGEGNITNSPLFIDYAGGNLHLQPNSPCIDAGNNAFVIYNTTDLDGNPRIFNGTVDIGAYEFQQPSAPLVTQQPLSQAVLVGTNVTFSVGVRGSLPLSWQWLFESSPIRDATNSILTLARVMTNQAGGYSVVVTNSVGSVTSQVAILTVEGAPPQINQQPLNQTVYVGSNVVFTVGTVSVLPLSWQWRYNGSVIAGGTTPSLTIPSVQTNQAGGYSVVVTNFLGSVTSQVAVLTVLDAVPSITVQPVAQTVPTGSKVTFSVGAVGSLPMFWQWRFNGTAIPGAINASLMLPAVTTDQSGVYSVIVSNTLGNVTSQDATLTVVPPVEIYVWQDSPSPTPPYTNWATAAHVIQDAVDIADIGDEVVVTNGIYASGGRTFGTSLLTNRVVLTKPLWLRSVNGPDVTVIQGYQVPGVTNGDAAIRCVYMTSNAVISGFTLTNGATRQAPGPVPDLDFSGGAIYCDTWDGALAINCKLLGNCASESGGGSFFCALNNSLVANNSAGMYGGGVVAAPVTNCTVVGNFALQGGGGVYGSSLYNSISYYNQVAGFDANYVADKGIIILSSCITPPPGPVEWQNISAEPLFADLANGNFHLQAGSPCINAGNNALVSGTTDLDGNPRIVGGTVDIGAYEFQHTASVIPLTWLQYYGLPTDGSADFIDTDGDGMNNWQEWVCGTNPTNALSVLRVLSTTASGPNITVTWQSVAGVNYFLTRGINLDVPFALSPTNFIVVATNVVGQPGTTSYVDTNAVGQFFYRVCVKAP
jgi:hypothetical protein